MEALQLTKEQQLALKRKLHAFENAVVEYSWKGSKDPDEAEECEAYYKKARTNLFAFLGLVG